MSGNTERKTLKIFIWKLKDVEDGCRCQMIAAGYSASEAEQQALKTIAKEVGCAYCIHPHIYCDDDEDDIDDIATWRNYVMTTPPLIFDLDKGALLLS